jgi:hypothetical protein
MSSLITGAIFKLKIGFRQNNNITPRGYIMIINLKGNKMKTSTTYNVYVLDDSDDNFDICGEFQTLELAREYIKYQMVEDSKRLFNDKYAIYINVEMFLE